MVELFCGSATMANTFHAHGFDIYTVDTRNRKGKCEPTHRANVLDLGVNKFYAGEVEFLHIGLPCTIWSYASRGLHLDADFNPKTTQAIKDLELLKHVINLVDTWQPRFFTIENPRGKLRHYDPFKKWLDHKNCRALLFTLGSFGFPTTKPTNLFTNMPFPIQIQNMPYGRGNKSPGTFDNLTVHQRQTYPQEFCNFVYSNYLLNL